MEVYLDNSATTKSFESVRDVVVQTMMEDYGNPSSVHKKGFESERYITWSKDVISKILKVQSKEIYFTSGGTESDNLALCGAARANARMGKHLITTSVEHPAILKTMLQLEEEGFEVTYLPVNQYGEIRLDDLKNALRPDTILVSIMYVNNEVGALQPIEDAAYMVKSYNRRILFHTDAVQAFGKYFIYPKKMNIDMLSVSAHKIHGPKGVGFLYADQKVKIHPIIFGGSQQNGLRPGTINTPGVAGMATACKEIYENIEKSHNRMRELKNYFAEKIIDIDDVVIHSNISEESAPHILSVGFGDVKSEVLLHSLAEKGIYVSAGSACSANQPGVSNVLREIAIDAKYLHSTIRFSLSEFTTREEIDYTIETLYNMIPVLRRYTRR